MRSIEDILIRTHKTAAPVCGQISLALVRRKVRVQSLECWILELKNSIKILERGLDLLSEGKDSSA